MNDFPQAVIDRLNRAWDAFQADPWATSLAGLKPAWPFLFLLVAALVLRARRGSGMRYFLLLLLPFAPAIIKAAGQIVDGCMKAVGTPSELASVVTQYHYAMPLAFVGGMMVLHSQRKLALALRALQFLGVGVVTATVYPVVAYLLFPLHVAMQPDALVEIVRTHAAEMSESPLIQGPLNYAYGGVLVNVAVATALALAVVSLVGSGMTRVRSWRRGAK